MKTFSEFNKESSLKIYFLVGIQGSGKSFWVKNNLKILGNYIHANMDSYRIELQNKMRKNDHKWKFDHYDRKSQKQIFQKLQFETEKAIKENKNLILDNMNLSSKRRKGSIQNIKSLARKYKRNIEFIAVYFPSNIEKSYKRISNSRNKNDINYVNKKIISNCAEKCSSPKKEEGFNKIITIQY